MISKVLGLLLICVSVGVIYSLKPLNPLSGNSPSEVSNEQQLTIASRDLIPECALIVEELNKIGVTNSFQKISVQINEESLKSDDYLRIVSSCFHKSADTPLNLTIDAFTSNFGETKGNDLLLQLSFFDHMTNNKVNETTIRFSDIGTKKNPE